MNDQEKTKQQLIAELDELRQRVATLEASERRYRTIIDTVPLTIGEINRDGTVVFVNAATEKIYGYTPEEMVGSNSWDRIERGARSGSVSDLVLSHHVGTAATESGLRLPSQEER